MRCTALPRSCFTYETSVGIDVFNGLVDLLFVIDLVLNFRTAYVPRLEFTLHHAVCEPVACSALAIAYCLPHLASQVL